ILTGGWLIFRLQRRLFNLESRLGTIGVTLSSGSSNLAAGLAVGAPAPAFQLAGMDGKTTTLDSLRSAGKPIVLVFTDTKCGPCKQLLPTLRHWQHAYADRLAIVNINSGHLAANEVTSGGHHLQNVLQSIDREIVHAYQALVLPSAVLIRLD